MDSLEIRERRLDIGTEVSVLGRHVDDVAAADCDVRHFAGSRRPFAVLPPDRRRERLVARWIAAGPLGVGLILLAGAAGALAGWVGVALFVSFEFAVGVLEAVIWSLFLLLGALFVVSLPVFFLLGLFVKVKRLGSQLRAVGTKSWTPQGVGIPVTLR